MKYIRLHFLLAIFFVCAVSLAMVLPGPLAVDAKELSKPLFSSPIPKDDDDDDDDRSSFAETRGEVDPDRGGGEDKPIKDPETPGFAVIFPKNSIQDPVQVKFFNSGLPQGVPALPNNRGPIPTSAIPDGTDSPYFFFGAWKRMGEGGAIRQFNRSILINISYQDAHLTTSQEEQLRLWMYNPALQAWIKVGGRVDIFNKVVVGILSSTTPLEANGNALFTLAVDDGPDLKQRVDEFGKTTLSLSGRDDFRFHLLPGTVKVGSHFEVTSLAHIPDTNSFQLLANPVNINAYYVDHHHHDYTNDHQITECPKPVTVEFDYNADMLARAGNVANLTIVTLRNGQWVDVEELGYNVTRSGNKINVDTDKLGTFGLAIKP